MVRFLGGAAILILLLVPDGVRAEVLLWAPADQASGSTDSAAVLIASLERLGVEARLSESLLGQDLSGFEAVLAVLGTFPRKHVPTAEEGAALAAYLENRGGALYWEGGDAVTDLPAALAPLLGATVVSDGAGDLAVLEGLTAGAGPNLAGVIARYSGENRSLDRLAPAGEGSAALWRNRDTGVVLGVFHAAPRGYRCVTSSFEFGGLSGPIDEVLRSYLLALGVLESCAPAVRGLSVTVTGRRVRLSWTNAAAYTELLLERPSLPPQSLPPDSQSIDEDQGPGENLYELIAVVGECRSAPAFATAVVLEGAHVVWRAVETLPGLQDSAAEVIAALESNGRPVVTVPVLAGQDLHAVLGLWVILGTYPFRHHLTVEEGQLLADYLAGGAGPPRPRLYLEGGDVWSGPATALRGLDGVRFVADAGAQPLRHLRGLDSGAGLDLSELVRLPVDYGPEAESLDVIAPDPAVAGAGAAWVDDDSGDVIGVYRQDPGGRFAMLSASFEFGGVTRTREERTLLMELYLTALESPAVEPEPLFRRGDVDGDGAVLLNDPIQIIGRLFLGGVYDQDCEDAADADDDGEVGITDAIVVLNYLYLAGPAPADPGPEACGPDPLEDVLPECHPREGVCGG